MAKEKVGPKPKMEIAESVQLVPMTELKDAMRQILSATSNPKNKNTTSQKTPETLSDNGLELTTS